jgi:hypothetical protein
VSPAGFGPGRCAQADGVLFLSKRFAVGFWRVSLPLVLLASAPARADEVGTPLLAADPARQAEYDRNTPKSVLQIQRFRSESRADLALPDGRKGVGLLVDVQPEIGRAWLLTLDWEGRAPLTWHLESRDALRLVFSGGDLAVVRPDGSRVACGVVADGGARLEKARLSGQAFTPICEELVVVRGVVDGRKTSIEWTTDFLRDNIPGGEAITQFVRDTFFSDDHLKQGVVRAGDAGGGADGGPPAARIDPALQGATVVPQDFGLPIEGSPAALELGAWYPVARQPGVWASVTKPAAIDPALIAELEGRIVALDAVEKEALVYSVAFDLDQFQVDFTLGTEHPRIEWSDRIPETTRAKAPELPGPDGFAEVAPLVRVGQVDPEEVEGVAAIFTGGFKRTHGAFSTGRFSYTNLGTHYGFVEDGVVYSKLQPGLATVVGWSDGTVTLETWSEDRDALASQIRFARQNGVSMLEPDPASGEVVTNPLVLRWTGGNWASSPEAKLRSLRAAGSIVERDGTRYLVYSWFSDATPSAMAATLMSYGMSYSMLLDMNALEHTYMAVYEPTGDGPQPRHLVTGMSVLDRADDQGHVLPRFLAFPDNRDFFALSRKP